VGQPGTVLIFQLCGGSLGALRDLFQFVGSGAAIAVQLCLALIFQLIQEK